MSDLDTAPITGKGVPRGVGPGTAVHAGTLNLSGAIEVVVRHVGEGTLLAEIVRLMEAADGRRARFVGVAWQTALLYAFAVLIITCPCALGLAVPACRSSRLTVCSRMAPS